MASTSILIILRSFLMLAAGVLPVVLWKRRHRSAAALLGLGAAAWALSVALKIGWAVPTNAFVRTFFERHLGTSVSAPVFAGYLGLLTGVFEVGLVCLAARKVRRLREASLNDAIAFGLAFGGIEAVVLGFASFVALAQRDGFSLASVLSGPVERASAVLIHVVCCVLVLRPATRSRPWRSFALSFLFKSTIDAIAAFAITELGVSRSAPKLLVFEAVIAILACASAFLIFRTPAPPMRTAEI